MLAPALILSPYFGVQSDRVNPRHGLIFSMLFHSSIGLVGAITTFLGAFNELMLLLLAAALGSASAIHNPMRLALVPLLVPRSATMIALTCRLGPRVRMISTFRRSALDALTAT